MKKFILFILALTLVFASTLYAHDTYVAKESAAFVIVHGHAGKQEPYNPQFIKDAKAFDASGKVVAVTMKPQKDRVLLSFAKDPALVEFVYDTGPRVKTPEGWKSLSKREAKNAIESKKWVKGVKQINQWSDRFGKPLGGKMEIVPMKNPLALKVGDKLPFQVLYNGKPLPGVAVSNEGHGKDEIKTDPNGRAEVVIKKSGLNIVGASQNTPTPNDPDVDALGEIATLTFEVK
jgi:nickel transport protein